VNSVFEMTYKFNFDLLSFLRKSFESVFEENFRSYSKKVNVSVILISAISLFLDQFSKLEGDAFWSYSESI
jgi:hypothetical protein